MVDALPTEASNMVDSFCIHLDKLSFKYENDRIKFQNMFYEGNLLLESFYYFKLFLNEIFKIQCDVSLCLQEWKRAQQRSIIGGSLNYDIFDRILKYNNIILNLYHQCLEDIEKNNVIVEFHPELANLVILIETRIHLLYQNSFIVMEQPCSSILRHDPLTIISNAKFELKLCFLFDLKFIGSIPTCMKDFVNLRLLVEDEILEVVHQGLEPVLEKKPSFNITNKAEPVLFFQSGCLPVISIVCTLQVDINRRGHNPKAVPVVEKKFKFVFWFPVKIRGKRFICYTFSLPVNVLSRKDYRNSYATIFWDNAFPVKDRQMFETRQSVKWKELAEVLNLKFRKDVGVGLTAEHLDFIYTMIPRTMNHEHHLDQRNEYENLVTWEHFAKNLLPMRQFTFFEWFYRILVLVREQLIQEYKDCVIHGFISPEKAEKLLQECVDGTFLIRFSITFCGAITITYVKNRKVEKVLPWDLDQLKKISLAQTIKCTEMLLYLHPNFPKDEVFAKYYLPSKPIKSITGKDYINCNGYQVLSTT